MLTNNQALTNNEALKGMVLRATDGEIGTVDDLYFDDQSWTIRYLTVETGSWLSGRKVLIAPRSILQTDAKAGRIDVSFTRKQIENAPHIDTHRPVSRQHELEYASYYGYANYWDGPSYIPVLAPGFVTEQPPANPADAHLRSTHAVSGYHIDAMDGDIGHVARFLIDDVSWQIRYLEVATRNWWPGKKVLLSPAWIERVSWEESKVFVALTRQTIETCPEYIDSLPLTREYENKVYFHYGHPPYWVEEAKARSARA